MRIVNKQDFYKLPCGTLYSDYVPMVFVGLKIKGETSYYNGEPIDFYYENLIGNVDANSSGDYAEIMDKCEDGSVEFNLDFDVSERDGLYQEDSLYAIYSRDEIERFSSKIASCNILNKL